MNSNSKQIAIWSTVLIGCVAIAFYLWTRPAPEPRPFTGDEQGVIDSRPSLEEREKFFSSSVDPQIAKANAANRQAAERCVQQIETSVDGYRKGIPPFVKDINSWGTRFAVTRRLGSDWWNKDTEVASFVGQKVRTHLFDDERIKADINSALASFRQEILANEQSMLVSIRAAVDTHGELEIPADQFDDFAKIVEANMIEFAGTLAKDSILGGLVTELVSGVGGVAATQLVYLIGSRIATMTVFSAAAAGGATVATTGGGAAAGTTVGPLGTAAGFVGGLAVGLVIDWWWSKSYEAELTTRLNEAIDNVKIGAVQGSDGNDGLLIALDKACEQLQLTYNETLYSQIVQGSVQ